MAGVGPAQVDAPRLANEPTLLLSMGYDSLPAWFILGKPQALYIATGSRYEAAEVRRFEALRARYPEARLHLHTADAWMAREEIGGTAFVPLRNALMVMLAWALGADDVVLAAATDYGPDKRLAFTLSLGLAGRIAMGRSGGRHLQGRRGRLRVRRPFLWRTKDQMLTAAHRVTGDWRWLDLVYSCYQGTEPPCGQCRACRRTAVALAAAGAPPPHDTLRLPLMSLRETLRYMPNALDFGHLPALPELAFLPLRTAMAVRAWRRRKALDTPDTMTDVDQPTERELVEYRRAQCPIVTRFRVQADAEQIKNDSTSAGAKGLYVFRCECGGFHITSIRATMEWVQQRRQRPQA